jgi:hypothetical protein
MRVEKSSFCPETSSKQAVQEFHLRSALILSFYTSFPLFSVQLHRVEGAALLRELQDPGVHRGGPGEAADEDY